MESSQRYYSDVSSCGRAEVRSKWVWSRAAEKKNKKKVETNEKASQSFLPCLRPTGLKVKRVGWVAMNVMHTEVDKAASSIAWERSRGGGGGDEKRMGRGGGTLKHAQFLCLF